MHPSLEHIDTCVPVTALKALVVRDVKLLLQAQGTYIRLIDEGSGRQLAELKAFKRNNVHGFISLSHNEAVTGKAHVQFVAWGGQSVRAFDLVLSEEREYQPRLVAASAEYQGPDWILAGCAPDDEESKVYVLTAHNAVLGLDIVDGDQSNYGKAIQIRPLVTGVNTILYSADIIALSESHILIAAGTVFGEIIVWSCFLTETGQATGSIHHFFTGHEGSIFGVRISPAIDSLRGGQSGRLLASCSDDRTIRIWDISDCERISRDDAPAYSTDGFELRSTGFGAAHDSELGSESTIASAFGHLARIWGVNFLSVGQSPGKLNLLSRGEDATCILWDLTWDPASQKPQFQLNEGMSIRKHTGKHIWSLEVRSTDNAAVIYTGGADGAVKNFTIEADDGALILPNLHNQIGMSIDPQNPEPHVETSIKGFEFVSQDEFVAVTARGEIQIGQIKSQNRATQHIFKETIFFEEDMRSYSVVGSLSQKGVALLGNARGLIRFYNHNTKSLTRIVEVGQRPLGLFVLDYDQTESSANLTFVVAYPKSEVADLFMVSMSGDAEPSVDRIALNLPYGFGVTSASLVYDNQFLAVGSMTGNFALYRVSKTESLEPVMPPSKLHGREGLSYIASFSSLYGEGEDLQPYFLTCGRSGAYGVHKLEISGVEPSVSMRTLHLASLAFNCEVQGAYIDKVSQDLMIYGFQPMDFVLWNESAQTEVARHRCNGGRRSWAFQPSQATAWAGSFLWIQSGFNAMEIQPDASRTLRSGNHGREVKAMCATQQSDGLGPLFATGSEDTNVRIFAPSEPQLESRWGAFKCLRLLREHHTGLQSVGWSKDGRFLFTSGGYEQFLVWRTHSIPRFGLGTILDASCPKSDPKSDLRVTSFDVLDVEEQAEGAFLLCLTYSNSTIKIFHYSSSAEGGRFTLLANGTYMSNCLTQARFMRKGSSLSLITSSTDGYFTLWDLTTVLEPFYTMSSSLRLKQPVEGASITPASITCENRYQIHWNSIKCLELADVSDTLSLIVAGGDDNAMTVTLLDTSVDAACTIAVPDAHAACIAATKILTQSQNPNEGTARLAVASSGNDHQVKIWWIDIDARKNGPDRIQISKAAERYSSVADISSLDIIHDATQGSKLVVCGAGMEMLSVRL
ncbi:WD repeat protein [Aspergillus sclerotioniger CBS 115572]|uniref:WD repeat protein n=1 Tax=Aspergillus sclerotioniger CBS 115572 TaxID=1450535 RepID=A0A317VXK7_9EURO|nr:WD repeat protein [Aspergillus sclerotioniger CBS 115572]PWY78525.1 WD repeat protein [Aspergillus sclerotioniger CBS 115572]